jgi:Ca2+-binding EF-hand superfamily protein
MFDTKLAL